MKYPGHSLVDGELLESTLIMKTNGTETEIDRICEANLKTEDTEDK